MTDHSDPYNQDYGALQDVEAEDQSDRRRIELDDLRRILSMKEGRRVLWRYVGTANLMLTSFRGENTHNTAYQEGIKQIGRQMLADIDEADPDAYFQMRKEALEFEETRKQIKKNKIRQLDKEQ